MKSFKYTLVIVFSLLITNTSFAQTQTTPATQDTEKLSLDSGTIDSQFEFVVKKSSNWRDEKGRSYEVIRRNWVATLRAHTLDSLKAARKTLTDTRVIVDKQAKEIEELKGNLSNTQGTLEQTNLEKDSMNLFGMQISKGGYSALLWTIIAGLLGLLLLFIYKFKNSNTVTKQAKHNLAEIETEFEEHRRTALEREQKVRRQLQDEINKHKNN